MEWTQGFKKAHCRHGRVFQDAWVCLLSIRYAQIAGMGLRAYNDPQP